MKCKVLDSAKFVKGQVYKMDKAVDIAYACMLSKVPCLFVGNPGTGKSHTFKLIAKMFGVRDEDWFYQSITAKTSPEKLFGGIKAHEMLQGIETYNLDVGAATKTGNIFDELFKSTHPAMMNALLSYFDEEPTIFSGGKNIKPVWEWAFTTTNFEDLPEDLKYNPLWDRMAAKYIVDNLSATDSKHTLKMVMQQKASEAQCPSLTIEDLEVARKSAIAIPVSDSLIDTFYEKVLVKLQKYAYISQRKINSIFVGKPGCPSIIQSLMYVTGDVTDEVLAYIPYFVWQNVKTLQEMIEDVSAAIILPVVKVYKQIIEDMERFINEVKEGHYKNYDIAKQRLNMLREGASTAVMAFDEKTKKQVPIVVRQYAKTLSVDADLVVKKMIEKTLDDVDF